MNLRILMQAGPTKANELFAKLAETSDGAVKTREKLFEELKTELELHANLEEQHLFPVLRRNAETKALVAEAIKDNKALRAKLAELEVLPKNDATFPEGLKELQKTFREHARNEKRELLPAVQRALSEEQVQTVAEKIEAGVAEAERAKHEELEARRAQAREERERAQKQAEEAAERERQAAAERARREERERQQAQERAAREQAARQAEEAIAPRTRDEINSSIRESAEIEQTSAERIAEATARGEAVGAASIQAAMSNFRTIARLPGTMVGTMVDMRSVWMDGIRQAALTGAQMSQDMVRHAAEQQLRITAAAVENWIEYNASVMRLTLNMAERRRPFATGFYNYRRNEES